MADIDFASIPPASSNIPADGYDIAGTASRAALAGAPVVLRFFTGITGADGTWPEVTISVGADGSVTMPDGYEPVISDGKVTGWRELEPAGG